MLFWSRFGILLALAPIPFLIAAWYAFIRDRDVAVSRKVVAALGLLLATYCTIPGMCFVIEGLTRKHYWNRPIVSPTLLDRLFLVTIVFEFMCFIFVPIAAILSVFFLAAIRGRTLRYGAIAATVAWVMLWISVAK
jgi:hypothetical protein